MTPRGVHMMILDGFADWERAHALAELRRSGNHSRPRKISPTMNTERHSDK